MEGYGKEFWRDKARNQTLTEEEIRKTRLISIMSKPILIVVVVDVVEKKVRSKNGFNIG